MILKMAVFELQGEVIPPEQVYERGLYDGETELDIEDIRYDGKKLMQGLADAILNEGWDDTLKFDQIWFNPGEANFVIMIEAVDAHVYTFVVQNYELLFTIEFENDDYEKAEEDLLKKKILDSNSISIYEH